VVSRKAGLTISTTTLELDTDRAAVHEDIALDHTGRLSRSEHIKQRSLYVSRWPNDTSLPGAHLSSSRGTHERGERSGLDVSVHIREQLLLATLDRDMIVLPSAPPA